MDTYRVELVNRGGIEIDVAPDVQILDAILRWRGDANEHSGLRLPVLLVAVMVLASLVLPN